ncbi:MAG TPA: CHAT domain-containing protein [Candidatus Dormibacteraeota bacterium]|nr:CHAT domain-containing protein [Candidatus Dormibacteraeota bacterium]
MRTPNSDRPQSLLDVQAVIARGLREAPQNAPLLAAKGEANLLEGSNDAAITDLQEALNLEPQSPSTLDGLATAYFERAESEGRLEDYATAFELQSRALELKKDDPVVLFNRAITGSRLYFYEQSMTDWRRYLALVPTGGWADEARERFADVTNIVEEHAEKRKHPLMSPPEIARTVNLSDPKSWEEIEARVEEYFSVAVSDWLPSAFPPDHAHRDSPEARHALEILALVLDRNHGDRWLKELLSNSSSDHFAAAIDALRSAVKANNADYVLAERKAAEAAQLFSLAGNSAGEMRARFERLYALRLSDAGPECLRLLARLAPDVEKLPYRRLKAQLHMERYNCSMEIGNLDQFDQLTAAYRDAEAGHYPALALRVLSMQASDDLFKGRERSALQRYQQGLKKYWSGSTTSYLGRAFYSELVSFLEGKEQWYTDAVAAKQDLAIADPNQDPLSLAIEHTDLAQALLMARRPDEAGQELNAAQDLLVSVPQTDVTNNYRLTVECYSALALGQSGHAEAASERLDRVRPQLARIANTNVVADFYRVAGKLDNLAGRPELAEKELISAVALGEKMRGSLRTESERVSWQHEWQRPYVDFVDSELQLGKARESLELWELYRDPAVAPLSDTKQSPLPADDTEAAVASTRRALMRESERLNQTLPLLKGQSVLVVALVPHGLATWLYDDRGVTGQLRRADPGNIRLQAQHLAELCSQPSSPLAVVRSASRELYRTLIEPVEADLRPHQPLIVETDEALSVVPFQVLVDGAGRYLQDDRPISYLPGLAYYTDSRTRVDRISADSSALVVASGGEPDEQLRPLADAVAEARNVAHHFGQAKMLTDDQASRSAISSRLSSTEVFHFAGHALGGEGRAGLLVSPEGHGPRRNIFDAEALGNVSMPRLSLAVLSACSTENGPEGGSQDYGSLARAFLSQGVPHVLATRWNVDSASSAFLMESFYNNLISGMPVSQALAQAESALRQKEPHPYYWAPFDAFGKN